MTSTSQRTGSLLLLSASVGAGHIRAAEAIAACARERYPGLSVTHLDCMQFVSPLFRKMYADSYLDLVKRHPALWGYLYDTTDKKSRNNPVRKLRLDIQRLSTIPLKKEIKKCCPDWIICTHFLPAELLDREKRKNRLATPVSVVVTDYDVHWMWVQKHLDLFFVAHQEIALRLAEREIPAERIVSSGIPVCPAFGSSPDAKIARASLGLNPTQITLLLMAGGFGVGCIDQTARMLLNLRDDIQLISVSGKNSALHKKTTDVARDYPGRMIPVGFTTSIENFMAASDLVITKPGGLTTAECLAMGKPMIIINPIPGQEERNTDYLLENGAALLAIDDVALKYKLNLLLSDAAMISRMQHNARAIGKPHAGYDILSRVLT